MSAIRIPLEAVESSSLAAIGYEPSRETLAVQFRSGEIYHYAGVSQATALELYNAPSRGAFYARAIKGRYWGERMTGVCPTCGSAHGWIGELCSDCGCDVYHVVPGKEHRHENARACGCDPRVGWVCLECRSAGRRAS